MASTTSSLQSESTIWAKLNIPLPKLKYENLTASGQGKGSTKWAAHSHTPVTVGEWRDLDALIVAEGKKDGNNATIAVDLESQLDTFARFAATVSEEEHVSQRLNTFLSVVSEGGFITDTVFNTRSNEFTSSPDLVAMKRDDIGLGVGDIAEYVSPEAGHRARVRKETVTKVRNLLVFPFETKPVWKFRWIDDDEAHTRIINEWEIPAAFDKEKMYAQAPLPEEWSDEKKKVFHLLRQIYGQMVSDHCKYGVFHVYERWFFCKRTEQGGLFISRVFDRRKRSPSVLQAIKTLVGFDDHRMKAATIHPASASKAVRASKMTKLSEPNITSDHGGPAESDKSSKSGDGKNPSTVGSGNVAATLFPWDCQVYDATGNILLMTPNKHPFLVVKMQQNARMRHVADEMANEAQLYAALAENQAVQDAIPRFYGYSTHLGVAMTCLDREGDDFDDIGVENVSEELKQSAVRAVCLLGEAGVLHNDLELRNIVQSRNDPCQAKIIDFGRAIFSSDKQLLTQQVERIKYLLGLPMSNGAGSVDRKGDRRQRVVITDQVNFAPQQHEKTPQRTSTTRRLPSEQPA